MASIMFVPTLPTPLLERPMGGYPLNGWIKQGLMSVGPKVILNGP